jgi:hypothetical protein
MSLTSRKACFLTSLMVCQLMATSAYADNSVSATEMSLKSGLHDAGHAIARGAHAAGHAISRGAHTVGHAFDRGAQRVHRAFVGTNTHKGSGGTAASGSGGSTEAPAPPPLEPVQEK